MSDCFVLYLLLTCMKKKTSGADKFTNNSHVRCYSWNTVAQKIGITAESARKQHDRYLQQSQKENK